MSESNSNSHSHKHNSSANSTLSMEKRISKIRFSMIFIVVALISLITWQRGFVSRAVMSHLEMNLTIIAVFVFSLVLPFIFLSKLKNDVVAFKALQEMWGDIRGKIESNNTDSLVKYQRCFHPGTIFHKPIFLSHAYDIVTEELVRTKNIKISVETMNTLVHSVEHTISEEKSLIMYLSGMMVFLGLIGTFTGLLQMVASIGGIIGSLASSTGAAGPEAFTQLLGALQEPLKGMATGFATSLFGLFGSLTIGLLGRYAGQAANVLKAEFEAWLVSIVQIETSKESKKPENVQQNSIGEHALLNMTGNILADYTKVAGRFDQVANVLNDLRKQQNSHQEVIQKIVEASYRQKENQVINSPTNSEEITLEIRQLGYQLQNLISSFSEKMDASNNSIKEALLDVNKNNIHGMKALSANQVQMTTQLSGSMERMLVEFEQGMKALSANQLQMSTQLSGSMERMLVEFEQGMKAVSTNQLQMSTQLSGSMERMLVENKEGVKSLSANQMQMSAQLSGSMDQLLGEIERRIKSYNPSSSNASLEHVMTNAVGEIGRILSSNMKGIEQNLAHISERQKHIVQDQSINNSDNSSLNAQRIENAISEGMASVSQTMEAVFSGYSGLLHMVIAAVERSSQRNNNEDVQNNATTKTTRESQIMGDLQRSHR